MTRLKARWLLTLSLVVVLVTAYILVSLPTPTFALPVRKYVWSRLQTPGWWEPWKSPSELTAKSTARAVHTRIWALDAAHPHAHSGSGYAKATVGTTVDEDPTSKFTWPINTATFPKTPGSNTKTWEASATGVITDSAYTFCWVSVHGGGYEHDSASN